jgi:hypothetical protein
MNGVMASEAVGALADLADGHDAEVQLGVRGTPLPRDRSDGLERSTTPTSVAATIEGRGLAS